MWTSRREEGLEDVKFEELHLAVEEDATTIETVYETAFVKSSSRRAEGLEDVEFEELPLAV